MYGTYQKPIGTSTSLLFTTLFWLRLIITDDVIIFPVRCTISIRFQYTLMIQSYSISVYSFYTNHTDDAQIELNKNQ